MRSAPARPLGEIAAPRGDRGMSTCTALQETFEAEGRKPGGHGALPGGKSIVVDAKAPLEAYLDAHETVDEAAREVKLKDHARRVRAHVVALAAKAYWAELADAPDFVVMFLPGEPFFAAALQYDATLVEFAADQRVVIASPTTLIALLRAVAYGWRRSASPGRRHQRVDRALTSACDARGPLPRRSGASSTGGPSWRIVGSLESRVLVTAAA
jgi:DNA recombination protein RmuC